MPGASLFESSVDAAVPAAPHHLLSDMLHQVQRSAEPAESATSQNLGGCKRTGSLQGLRKFCLKARDDLPSCGQGTGKIDILQTVCGGAVTWSRCYQVHFPAHPSFGLHTFRGAYFSVVSVCNWQCSCHHKMLSVCDEFSSCRRHCPGLAACGLVGLRWSLVLV